MAVSRIDLHIHSTASDGSDSPSAIAEQAASLHLAAFALTDHDTLEGLEEAETAAQRLGVPFVRGCEVSTHTEWGAAHFLGLWLPHDKERLTELQETLEVVRKDRAERNFRMTEKLQELGFPVNYEEVTAIAGNKVVARPHFAELLVKKGIVKTEVEAFEKYLGNGKPAYIPRKVLSPEEAVELLKRSGALVVMAHPRLLKAPRKALEQLIARLVPLGLDALEAYHSEHKPNDVRICVELARKYGLHLSGGSDYHGTHKKYIRMGYGKGSLCVRRGIYDDLLQYREDQGLID